MPAAGWPATLVAGAVLLRPPRMRDARAWSQLRLRNRTWLEQWEPTSAVPWEQRNSAASWPAVCSSLRRAGRAGTMLPFLIEYHGELVGQLSVAQVVWGAQKSATIGYWVDEMFAGRGIVPVAVALAVDHLLSAVGLHRVEIDIRPENAASLRVVDKLGLRREGYFERFLDIDGAWRDHVVFAVTAEEAHERPLLARLAQLPA